MPLALVSLGQTCALLVGGFDVSVAALMTFCVVVASYTMASDTSGWALVPGGARARRGRPGDRDLQRGAHPRPQASVDHRDARHVQHPRRRVAPPPRSPRGPDLERRHRAVSRRASSFVPIAFIAVVVLAVARRRVAVPHAHGPRAEGGRPRRDVVAPARDGDRPHRVPRVRRLLADGVARRLLPRGPGPDRLAAHRQLRRSRASPRPSSAERASRAGEGRSWARCSRRSSSR